MIVSDKERQERDTYIASVSKKWKDRDSYYYSCGDKPNIFCLNPVIIQSHTLAYNLSIYKRYHTPNGIVNIDKDKAASYRYFFLNISILVSVLVLLLIMLMTFI